MVDIRERANHIVGLAKRVDNARKLQGKKRGDVTTYSANCPECGGHQTVVIVSDGKRMFRLHCSKKNCLVAMG